MARRGARLIGIACILGCVAGSAWAAVTPQQVDAAIKKGVDYLYAQQNKAWNWETSAGPGPNPMVDPNNNDPAMGQWGGRSAIATYALLVAGEDYRDKRLAGAIDWINRAPMIGIYAVGLRAQVWMYLPPNAKVKQAARRDLSMLLNGMKS